MQLKELKSEEYKKSLDPLGFVLFKRLKQRKEEQMITLFTPQSGT
jgi:hypothetical protein